LFLRFVLVSVHPDVIRRGKIIVNVPSFHDTFSVFVEGNFVLCQDKTV
jgi:hypothetical protein